MAHPTIDDRKLRLLQAGVQIFRIHRSYPRKLFRRAFEFRPVRIIKPHTERPHATHAAIADHALRRAKNDLTQAFIQRAADHLARIQGRGRLQPLRQMSAREITAVLPYSTP